MLDTAIPPPLHDKSSHPAYEDCVVYISGSFNFISVSKPDSGSESIQTKATADNIPPSAFITETNDPHDEIGAHQKRIDPYNEGHSGGFILTCKILQNKVFKLSKHD